MNLLVIDTETSPNAVDTWGLRDQNIAINQIRKPGGLLCFAAKWYGSPEDEVIFDSINQSSRKQMVRHLHSLYTDADAVIGYNSIAFDTKVVNKEFLLQGLRPPAPFKQVDLLRTMRQNFRFASNKLDFVAQQLELGAKTHHMGHGLWTACEQGDQEAWALMEKYNKQDVLLTEKLYARVLPWIKNHPNRGSFDEPGLRVCPTCGGAKLQRRGFARTVANKYVRLQCVGCGTWCREAFTENTRLDRQEIIRQV
jgi:hypothetical protein